MTFIEPLLLAALPLIALPVLIHLINQHRHRTVHWGAMMFLRTAKRMTKGMAKLKHFLILLMRMLAIAGLIFAMSRPLASGWLGLAAGTTADTTIIILDRSASMEQQDEQGQASKRSTAINKLAELLDNLGSTSRLVLIESTRGKPEEIPGPEALADLPQTEASSTSADLPTLMQTALDYINANDSGRTDVWVCSDLRENDWDAAGGRWQGLRSGFVEKEGIHFYLLTYADIARDNVSITVANVHRRQIGSDAELVMDLRLRRESHTSEPLTVPIQLVINGARSQLQIEMNDKEYERLGHTIPIDRETRVGHGRVELPNDSNPQDNVFHFVFAEPPVHRTVIVSDDKEATSLLQLAAGSPAVTSVDYKADTLKSSQIDEIPWNETAMLLWHAPLPDGLAAEQLQNFVDSGRTVIFFPPDEAGDSSVFGTSWGDWKQGENKAAIDVAWWDRQSDLLADSQSGAQLPVTDLKAYRYCSLKGDDLSRIARLDGGSPLLARVPTLTGGVYFCSTLPQTSYSTFSTNPIVFYIMLQRALSAGAASLGKARQMEAGNPGIGDLADWRAADKATDALLSQRPFQRGAWTNEDRLLAVNRPAAEDSAPVLGEEKIDELFAGLDYTQISDQVGDASSLANEIWKSFLIAMVIALLVEAGLCIPERRVAAEAE